VIWLRRTAASKATPTAANASDAAYLAIMMIRGRDAGWWGQFPIAIGAALFVVYLVVRRKSLSGGPKS
jgi:hypothetical protein